MTWADIGLHGSNAQPAVAEVVWANSMSVPGLPGEVDDIDTVILSRRDSESTAQQAVAIVTTSMTLPGSSKPAFYLRLQAKKSAPSVRIEGTKASVAIPFPPIRPQELHVQWYGDKYLDESGIEKDEVIHRPVKRGWGLWYQADVIAARIAQRRSAAEGEVIGYEESMRVLWWMDEARKQAGILYDFERGLN